MNRTQSLRRNAAALTVLAALLASGCSLLAHDDPTAQPQPSAASPAPFPRPMPDGVKDPAEIPASQAGVADCDPRSSYRPISPAPASASATLARIRTRRELKVGTSQTGYLMSFQDSLTGDRSGFEVDIIKEIASELGKGIEGFRTTFVEVTAADRQKALNDGLVDIMLRSVAMTCARWKETAFSAEYLTSGQRVLVSKTSPFEGMDSLGGRKVCAAQGSTNLVAIAAAGSGPKPVSARNIADCMLLLQQGYVDAVSSGDVVLAGLAQQDGTTHIVGPRFTDEAIGVAISLDAIDLVRIVNGVLERIRADGSWDRFYDKWLQPSLDKASAPVPRYRD